MSKLLRISRRAIRGWLGANESAGSPAGFPADDSSAPWVTGQMWKARPAESVTRCVASTPAMRKSDAG
jgi:hypothetical protein